MYLVKEAEEGCSAVGFVDVDVVVVDEIVVKEVGWAAFIMGSV